MSLKGNASSPGVLPLPKTSFEDPPGDVPRPGLPKIKLFMSGANKQPQLPPELAVPTQDRVQTRPVLLKLPANGAAPRSSSLSSSWREGSNAIRSAVSPAVRPPPAQIVEEYSEDEDDDDDEDGALGGGAQFDAARGGLGFPRINGPTETLAQTGGIDPRAMFQAPSRTSSGAALASPTRSLASSPFAASPGGGYFGGSDGGVDSDDSGETGTNDGYPEAATEDGGDGDLQSHADSVGTGAPGGLPGGLTVPGKRGKSRKSKWSSRKRAALPEGYVRKPKLLPKRPISVVLSGIVARLKKWVGGRVRAWRSFERQLILSFPPRHDAYGFFWHPVNPKEVPEYAKIISNPMDFETMSKKIDNRQYADIHEFRNDFQLIVDNCRTFNPPTSPYHKAASKLEAYGMPIIEREASAVYTLAESMELYPEERLPAAAAPPPAPVAAPAINPYSAAAYVGDTEPDPKNSKFVPPRKRYEKRPKVRRFHGFDNLDTDGSLFMETDDQAWDKVPPVTRWERFLDVRHRVTPEDVLDPSAVPRSSQQYLFMGAPTKSTKLPEGEYTASVFGSAANQTYIESMLAFADGASPEVLAYARRKAAKLTQGGTESVRAIVDLSAAALEGKPVPRLPKFLGPQLAPIKEEIAKVKAAADKAKLAAMLSEQKDSNMHWLSEQLENEAAEFAVLPAAEIRQMAAQNLNEMKLLIEWDKAKEKAEKDMSPEDVAKLAHIPTMLQGPIIKRLGAWAVTGLQQGF